jgi:hypothetical protein
MGNSCCRQWGIIIVVDGMTCFRKDVELPERNEPRAFRCLFATGLCAWSESILTNRFQPKPNGRLWLTFCAWIQYLQKAETQH